MTAAEGQIVQAIGLCRRRALAARAARLCARRELPPRITAGHITLRPAPTGGLPGLRSFATGLKRDYGAVRNGLTLDHSSGAVEGNVNRIKMIKQQMYRRAGFGLLRKRVLLTT
jgi:transposase